MRLLIISHTPHYFKSGTIVGWGPTIREIDQLASLFSSVSHIAPLHNQQPPESSLAYQENNVVFKGVKPSGGNTLFEKLKIILQIPGYVKIIFDEMRNVDIVHVRCPANISFIALFLLIFIKKPKLRWVKYAGNWLTYPNEPILYKIQKWILRKNLIRGFVTINGKWKNQEKHIFSFYNPSLSFQELIISKEMALGKEIDFPIRIIFVGRVESAKGIGRIIEISKFLKDSGLDFSIEIIGDGEERVHYQKISEDLGLSNNIFFSGWLPKDELGSRYKKAHFILFPSTASEGWPKVLSEAMSYGVVPITSTISSVPQILNDFGAGVAVPVDDIASYVSTILYLSTDIQQWKKFRDAGANSSYTFSYDYYKKAVRSAFFDFYQIDIIQHSFENEK